MGLFPGGRFVGIESESVVVKDWVIYQLEAGIKEILAVRLELVA